MSAVLRAAAVAAVLIGLPLSALAIGAAATAHVFAQDATPAVTVAAPSR